jgi:hypothetical protein
MTHLNQSGNVLFLILIAVALFAALSFVVTQSTRSTPGGVGKEKTLLQLNQVHNYGVNIKTAVSRLLTNGGSFDRLSFEDARFSADYTNPNCSTDSCRVFTSIGGSATWAEPPEGFNDGSDYIISGHSQVKGIGIDAPADPAAAELLLIVPNVSESTCLAINTTLNGGETTPIPNDSSGCIVDTGAANFYYRGSFTGANVVEDTADPNAFKARYEYCVRCPGAPDTYHFYSVISPQ